MTDTDPVADCQRAVDTAQQVLGAVSAGDLDRPTPCASWAVRDLVAHMIWMCQVFAAGLHGDDMPPAPGPIGDDPAATYAAAAAAAMDGWRTADWQDMTLALPFSQLPAAIGVRVFVGDALIHSWDLATALGRPFRIDDDLAATQLEMMQRFYDADNRGPDAAFDLAKACPPDASAGDRLIALSGRDLPGSS